LIPKKTKEGHQDLPGTKVKAGPLDNEMGAKKGIVDNSSCGCLTTGSLTSFFLETERRITYTLVD